MLLACLSRCKSCSDALNGSWVMQGSLFCEVRRGMETFREDKMARKEVGGLDLHQLSMWTRVGDRGR